jgi:hypothetical protein
MTCNRSSDRNEDTLPEIESFSKELSLREAHSLIAVFFVKSYGCGIFDHNVQHYVRRALLACPLCETIQHQTADALIPLALDYADTVHICLAGFSKYRRPFLYLSQEKSYNLPILLRDESFPFRRSDVPLKVLHPQLSGFIDQFVVHGGNPPVIIHEFMPDPQGFKTILQSSIPYCNQAAMHSELPTF